MDLAANLVGATLGPAGRNVAFSRALRAPRITNDGATVAKELDGLRNPILDMGLQLVKHVAATADDVIGDGTTTAVVLAQAILHRGLYNIAAGAEASQLRKGLATGSDAATAALRDLARPVESTQQLEHVAAVSSEDPPLAKMIADAAEIVGPRGLLLVDFHRGTDRLATRYVDGMQVDRGWLSPLFDDGCGRAQVSLDRPWILLTDQDLSHECTLVPLLDKVRRSGHATVLIVANSVRDRALHFLLHNLDQGTLNVVAVQAPSFGSEMREMLEDMAALTGATVVLDSLGVNWNDVPINWLGRCRRAVVNREATVLLEGAGQRDDIKDRQRQLHAQCLHAQTETSRRQLEHRIARLGEAVGHILVGGTTELERHALKDKAEDALSSVHHARKAGVVPGGGAAFLRAQEAVANVAADLSGDAAAGARTLHDALESPIRRIARNAGEHPSVVTHRVRQMDSWGAWNAISGEYVDAYVDGLLDPLATGIAAITAATSIGHMVLATDTIVCNRLSAPMPRAPHIAPTRRPY